MRNAGWIPRISPLCYNLHLSENRPPSEEGSPINSCTKSVIGTLVAIASKDGLLDSTNHRALDFFDRTGIANLDNRKEAIIVQNLLDMTSGLEWEEPPYGFASSVIAMISRRSRSNHCPSR